LAKAQQQQHKSGGNGASGLPLKWMNFAKATVDNNQQQHKENE
jgi:hypothetical protein